MFAWTWSVEPIIMTKLLLKQTWYSDSIYSFSFFSSIRNVLFNIWNMFFELNQKLSLLMNDEQTKPIANWYSFLTISTFFGIRFYLIQHFFYFLLCYIIHYYSSISNVVVMSLMMWRQNLLNKLVFSILTRPFFINGEHTTIWFNFFSFCYVILFINLQCFCNVAIAFLLITPFYELL